MDYVKLKDVIALLEELDASTHNELSEASLSYNYIVLKVDGVREDLQNDNLHQITRDIIVDGLADYTNRMNDLDKKISFAHGTNYMTKEVLRKVKKLKVYNKVKGEDNVWDLL